MHTLITYIDINLATALQVVLLGFIGGILSGFIGSGGAFFMTPGMMNLGVDGVIAVASNITHKFGKAMVGSRKHAAAGNVDKKLAVFMLITAIIGIQIAVAINSYLFKGGGGGHGAGGSAGANLYISLVFAVILSTVSISMLKDILKSRGKGDEGGPSLKIAEFLSRLNLPPVIHFDVAETKVSLWVLMAGGISTGYLAGTIGVGGFIGVPAMIYVFGVPTAVATGTELFLALFMGAYGALSYAYQGFVDIRLTMLLYLGSLAGIHLGVYGVKVVNEKYIRVVTSLIILLCVFSRVIAIPIYLRQLEVISFDPVYDGYFNLASKFFLFASGISGAVVILFKVVQSYRQRRKIQKTLLVASNPELEMAGSNKAVS
ncbi:MAG: sulfite exporter TauE/SafE family protein [Desulfohalobiaceae bacterium]|nr:sulfite exporter TauE/SafE family protein [Desulfohalobiaceae bacterium]